MCWFKVDRCFRSEVLLVYASCNTFTRIVGFDPKKYVGSMHLLKAQDRLAMLNSSVINVKHNYMQLIADDLEFYLIDLKLMCIS